MLFIITNFAFEIVTNGIFWLVRKTIYGLSSYLIGLVYKKEEKFYIDEEKWKSLIEQNKLQQKEIHELREIVEKWTDLKSSTINKSYESPEDINKELTDFLEKSIIEKKL
jgi:hypothetical protein